MATTQQIFDIKSIKSEKKMIFLNVVFQEIVIFYHKCDIFASNVLIFKFQEFLWNCVILCMLEFWLSGEMGQHAHHI